MTGTMVRQIAFRYLRGKRAGNAVPILSRISMVAIAVGTGALIVIFSVFNGFEGLIKDLYKAFYPDLRVTAAHGKFFTIDTKAIEQIKQLKGINNLSLAIEDNVLANTDSQQIVVTLKGVDENYLKVNSISPYIVEGRKAIITTPIPTALVGLQIINELGIDVNNAFNNIVLYYPNPTVTNVALDPASAFNSLRLKPDGAFKLENDFDSKYMLAPLSAAQQLFDEQGKISSIEISVQKSANVERVKKQIQDILGDGYKTETRYEQNKTLYVVMNSEKWAVYAILLFILLIASFNMIGALSLLVLEKQKDIAILRAMGAELSDIRKIFLLEGVLWSLSGGLTGMVLGIGLCLGQQYFKWIKMQGAFIIEAYPVQIRWTDIPVVIITIVVVGILASWAPAVRATRTEMPGLKST